MMNFRQLHSSAKEKYQGRMLLAGQVNIQDSMVFLDNTGQRICIPSMKCILYAEPQAGVVSREENFRWAKLSVHTF